MRARGQRVLVLEARDRIGGRTWTDTYGGQLIERGGTWVEPTQPYLGAELKRYSLGLEEDEPISTTWLPTPSGPKQFTPEDGFGRIGTIFDRMFEGSRTYFEKPYQPLFRSDLLASLDKLSLRDRLNQLSLMPEEELLISGQTAVYSGGTSAMGAFTMFAQWWALAGHSNQGWDDTMRWRIAKGTKALLDAMINEAKPTVRLSSPVASVTDTGSLVYVTTKSGTQYNAAAVVVAMPVNALNTVKFSRPCPRCSPPPRARESPSRTPSSCGSTPARGRAGLTARVSREDHRSPCCCRSRRRPTACCTSPSAPIPGSTPPAPPRSRAPCSDSA
ncbi:FAD-dependent oxidoreductase [Streptomyces sp. INA 01156]